MKTVRMSIKERKYSLYIHVTSLPLLWAILYTAPIGDPTMRILALAVLALLVYVPLRATESSALIVHEWGTFTSMQNEFGQTLGGMNNEEELLPNFVHSMGRIIQSQARPRNDYFYKGLPANRPDVTMRLETPVVYFHLPDGVKETRLDLNVKFNGGYLTQYFPIAKTTPSDARELYNPITEKTQGGLNWNGLVVGTSKTPPETSSGIWNAPRNVNAANVQAASPDLPVDEFDEKAEKYNRRQVSQVEKYLFYRGVGRMNAPLMITRNENQLSIHPQYALWKEQYKPEHLARTVWLVDIREDGRVAWRRQELAIPQAAVKDAPLPTLATFPATFEASEYARADQVAGARGGMGALKHELQGALMAEGMFEDEANALLNTWDASYFKASGLRVFFMVPQAWTDEVLPLEVKTDLPLGKIKRAMVGRIELITPEQRALAGKIVASGMTNFGVAKQGPDVREYYQKLGRFRNVILLDVKQKLDYFINE